MSSQSITTQQKKVSRSSKALPIRILSTVLDSSFISLKKLRDTKLLIGFYIRQSVHILQKGGRRRRPKFKERRPFYYSKIQRNIITDSIKILSSVTETVSKTVSNVFLFSSLSKTEPIVEEKTPVVEVEPPTGHPPISQTVKKILANRNRRKLINSVRKAKYKFIPTPLINNLAFAYNLATPTLFVSPVHQLLRETGILENNINNNNIVPEERNLNNELNEVQEENVLRDPLVDSFDRTIAQTETQYYQDFGIPVEIEERPTFSEGNVGHVPDYFVEEEVEDDELSLVVDPEESFGGNDLDLLSYFTNTWMGLKCYF